MNQRQNGAFWWFSPILMKLGKCTRLSNSTQFSFPAVSAASHLEEKHLQELHKAQTLSQRGRAFPGSCLGRINQQARHRDLLTGRTATCDTDGLCRGDIPHVSKGSFHLDSTRCEIKSWHIWEMVHGEVINSIRGCGGNSFLFLLLRSRAEQESRIQIVTGQTLEMVTANLHCPPFKLF